MDCHEIFEGLSDFIDEVMAEAACEEIKKHLGDCHNCRVVINTLQHTVTLYHTFPPEELPGEVRSRLHKLIKMEKGGVEGEG